MYYDIELIKTIKLLFEPNGGVSLFFPTVFIFKLFQVFAVFRNVLLYCFCLFSFLNSFRFQYRNFYSWISFICLISFPCQMNITMHVDP